MKHIKINRESIRHRLSLIDAIRGAAIIGVVIFHIVWDLEFAGFISGVAFHTIWLTFGKILAGTFMLLVGVSLVLAHHEKFKKTGFLKRLLILSIAAAMITIVTWYAFPGTFIYFGILHAIAVASVIGVFFLKVPYPVTFIAGIIVLALPFFVSATAFDTRWFAWIGFSEIPPQSNDFVPIFPWIGLTLIGIAITLLMKEKFNLVELLGRYNSISYITRLGWFGQHSLIIYLLHQPILLAIILPVSHLKLS